MLDSDPDSEAQFGASVSIVGDTAVVGAPGDEVLINGETVGSGSASIFNRSAGLWTSVTRLAPGDGENGDEFGSSVDIDEETDLDILVGAPEKKVIENGFATSFKGRAYLYEPDGDEQKNFTGVDSDNGDEFGHSVAIDEELMHIGAPKEDGNGDNSGATYIAQTGHPSQLKHNASDGASDDQLGVSVEVVNISAKKSWRLAGAWFDDHSGEATAGSAYVFNGSSKANDEVAKLTANNPRQGALLGASVAVTPNHFIAGAPGDSEAAGASSGAFFVFNATFDQVAKKTASDAASFRDFGASVSTDRQRIIVGSPGAGSQTTQPGAAYIFR